MAINDTEYIGVSELAAAVGEALSEIANSDRRMKSGATEIPSERTIRFYLEKGLLPKPTKRLGQTLVFGRVHLLHLLVIKKLQADGVSLSAVPDILKKKGKTEAQLEELLGDQVEIFRTKRDLDELGPRRRRTGDDDVVASMPQAAMFPSARREPPSPSLSDMPPPDLAYSSPSADRPASDLRREEIGDKDIPRPSQAKSYLKSLLSRSAKPAAHQPTESEESLADVMFSISPSEDLPEPTARWSRHEPAPGLEINISDEYEPPTDEQGKKNLLETLRKILGLWS